MSAATSIPWFMLHTKAWRLQLEASSTTSTFSSIFSFSMPSFFFYNVEMFCVCVRLKSVIASDNQENDKSYNASFIQLLISFYIQSEVVSLSVSPSLFKRLSLKLMYHFLFIFYNFLDQQWDLKKTL